MKVLSRLCLAFLFAVSALAQAQPATSQAGAQPSGQPKEDEAPSAQQTQQERQKTQPGNNAPVWNKVQSGAPAYTSIPGRETDVLIQPQARFPGQDARTTAGEAWRQFRNGPVTFYGGWLVVVIAVVILAFYFRFGSVKLHGQPTGRLIRRFSSLDQIVHWTVAISFCVLGISGLIMLFGKHLLLPILGYTLFAWLTALGKNLHNFIAPVFIVSVIAMVILFIRYNLPRLYDIQFLVNAFAVMAKGKHVPSGKFNGGEKVWFWGGVIGLSVIVIYSGVILLFPNFDQTRAVMQDAWVWHASAALLYIGISLGHIYLGTLGLEGAYSAMRTGYVDETWAKEHHQYWYEEMKAKGQEGPRGAIPAGAPHMKEKS